MTRAMLFIRSRGVLAETRAYNYTAGPEIGKLAAKAIGVAEGELYKTLVFAVDAVPVLVLIDSAHRVSIRKLARASGASEAGECSPRDAERYTGYEIGGISPFATRRRLDVYVDAAIAGQRRVFVNGGRRGLLVAMDPKKLISLLDKPVIADLRVAQASDQVVK